MLSAATLLSLLGLACATPIPQYGGFGGGNTGFGGGTTSSTSTRNDVVDNLACKDVTLIFARGTSETGNLGTIAGPPLVSALGTTLGSHTLAVQGVTYSASVEGAVSGGDSAGSKTMASLVTQALSQCPKTLIVMSGYSQGGQLVHNAASMLPTATMAKVSSVVIFGDPDNGSAVTGLRSGRLLEICASGDSICQAPKSFIITAAHLSYGSDAQQAATFINSKAY